MTRPLAGVLALTLSVLLPRLAAAQTLYVVSPPAPGVAPTYTGWTNFTFDSDDDGGATLNLPFTFTYFGQSYSEVDLNTNGLLLFGNTYCEPTGSSSCLTRPTASPRIPISSTPNNFVAFWWDDMELFGTVGGQTVTSGTPGDRVFAIKFADWSTYNASAGRRSIQIELHERSGAIVLYYGPISGTASDDALVGFEDANGTLGEVALPCASTSSGCTSAAWPAGQYLVISPAIDPDLLVMEVSGSTLMPTTVDGQPGFSLDVSTTIKNQGQDPATGFLFDLYLSTDAIIDTSDTLLANHTVPETLAGRTEATFIESGVQFVRPPGSGNFYIGVIVDPTNLVAEAIESNNSRASAPYYSGVDLLGSITGPAGASPGDTVDLEITLGNRGLDPVPQPFDYAVFLSSDEAFDPGSDPILGSVQTAPGLGIGETRVLTASLQMPGVTPGSYRYLLVLDPPTAAMPDGAVSEVDETNNVSISAPVAVSAPDIVVGNLRVRAPVDPFPDLTEALFDDSVMVSFDLFNAGDGPARAFDVGIMFSDNAAISVYDQRLESAAGIALVGGETVSIDLLVRLPLAEPSGALWGNGIYHLGVIADLHSAVMESNKANNLASSEGIAVSHLAVACQAPSECASGFCVDGFCCDEACGDSDPLDCRACSLNAGAPIDGRCGPVESGTVCRPASGLCDVAEHCDGMSLPCPPDVPAAAGAFCDDSDPCTIDDVCDGLGDCAGSVACQPDAGLPPDAGAEVDAGVEPDAGMESDAGNDAGASPDAGVVADAGNAPDAGTVDAALPLLDAGAGGEVPEQASGCGCGAGAGMVDPLILLALGAFGWRVRRRR